MYGETWFSILIISFIPDISFYENLDFSPNKFNILKGFYILYALYIWLGFNINTSHIGIYFIPNTDLLKSIRNR